MVRPMLIVWALGLAVTVYAEIDFDTIGKYNKRSTELVDVINECNRQFDRMSLAANAFAKQYRRNKEVLDIRGAAPYSSPTALKEQLENQSRLFKECCADLYSAADKYDQAVRWIKTEDSIEGTFGQ